MKRNMDWRSWLALIVSMSILCGLSSHFFGLAHAEDEGYWLDEAAGVVILDDPAYFLDEEVGTPSDLPVDSPDDSHVDLKELFHVEVKVPSGWRSTPSATVRIKVTPKSKALWHSLRYRLDDGDWHALHSQELTLYDGYYYTDIEVFGNAKITVRLYDDEANWFDTSKEIRAGETYFLNLVDDRDLMSVVSADEIVATPTPQIVYVTPEPAQSPAQTTPVVVEDEGSAALPVLVLLVGAAAVGGVGFWWVKKQKEAGKARDAFAEEFELEEEEDEE